MDENHYIPPPGMFADVALDRCVNHHWFVLRVGDEPDRVCAECKLDQVRLAIATYESEKHEPGRRPDSTIATIDRIVGKKWMVESNPTKVPE